MWRGLYRWITRRPLELAPGDVAFGHAGPVKPIFAVFIVMSALEIPIFDLVISRLVPWSAVRYAALAAGDRPLDGLEVWLNAAFHYFCPSWTVVGWLLLGPRPRVTWQATSRSCW
jgi:hypothetical protein